MIPIRITSQSPFIFGNTFTLTKSSSTSPIPPTTKEKTSPIQNSLTTPTHTSPSACRFASSTAYTPQKRQAKKPKVSRQARCTEAGTRCALETACPRSTDKHLSLARWLRLMQRDARIARDSSAEIKCRSCCCGRAGAGEKMSCSPPPFVRAPKIDRSRRAGALGVLCVGK